MWRRGAGLVVGTAGILAGTVSHATEPPAGSTTAALAAEQAQFNKRLDPVEAKLHAQLRHAVAPDAAPRATSDALPVDLRDGDRILVEIEYMPDLPPEAADAALARTAGELRNRLGSERAEAWVPANRLRDLAGDPDVAAIHPARLVQHLIGSKTSQGIAAGRADLWHGATPALTGAGVKIAVIDGFDSTASHITQLQTSNDWPPNARLAQLAYRSAGCTTFGCAAVKHGNAVTEILYDVAPGASYRVYDTATVGDWRRAILDAAGLNASGGVAGPVQAHIISASLAAVRDGKGDGSALPGSIAEAAGWARNRGVLVVNAAGNSRLKHWDGLFTLAPGGLGRHTWNGSTVFNVLQAGPANNCIPAGQVIQLDMFWNDWNAAGSTHDFDLYLYRRINATTWEDLPVAQSNQLQSGGAAHKPQEWLQFTASGSTSGSGCAANSAVYGAVIVRVTGTTAVDNLEVFSSHDLTERVTARSLNFPADSPNVLSVAAIDVANTSATPQEGFSSEGPVLATGGGLPGSAPGTDSNLKPDLASYDNVSTVTYGNGGTSPPPVTSFLGTSAAAPHAAGMAALLMERNGIPTTAAQLQSSIIAPLRTVAATGSNDLGTAGKDYQYGNGRLRFQRESALGFLQQPTSVLVNQNITPAIRVRVLDDENQVVAVGPSEEVSLAFANDPSGGAAVLSGAGAAALVDGVATWSAVKISQGGTGYTLRASISGVTANSASFNVTTGPPARLRFGVQPSTVVAGQVIAPAVTVRVEDSNGNLVATDNATQVQLRRTSCLAAGLSGGRAVAVVNGVATFPALRLFGVGSGVQLQASASGMTAENSAAFSVTTAAEPLGFRSGFESCTP
ncbi:S8 family serine peptidase [Tahibacter amnicola]|uniref:S8 family serine peptidase n=1 Tax=Tahibacter amnicola TaxID=2976241 RepID=A0ABY6BGG2_9GAMM|nr:S8 family serine peptidase [Tahibacter amnicola]UXI68867.1 S8 family serine peptidase [Tahibacter amnicola]